MKKFYNTNQSGRSMVEMLGVLAIIGVLSVGGLTGYSKAMSKYKTNKTQEQLQLLISGIRTLYATQPSYTGITITQLISVGTMPDDMIRGGTTDKAYDPFGNEIYLVSTAADFTIGIENLTDKICVEIANANWQTSGNSLKKISIGTAPTGGTDFIWNPPTAGTGDLAQMDLAEIVTACAVADRGIYFTFQ